MAMPLSDIEFDRLQNQKAETDREWYDQCTLYFEERDQLIETLVKIHGQDVVNANVEAFGFEPLAKVLFRSDRKLTLDEVEMTMRINFDYIFDDLS